jgi:hypothetical protein
MVNEDFPDYRSTCRVWSHAFTSLLWNHWKLLDAQYRAGIGLLDAVRGAGPAGPPSLEEMAIERVSKGLPPPREVYEVQNRGRIDWSRFPEWAKPSDPETFEGVGHEG